MVPEHRPHGISHCHSSICRVAAGHSLQMWSVFIIQRMAVIAADQSQIPMDSDPKPSYLSLSENIAFFSTWILRGHQEKMLIFNLLKFP